jgi:hypothetical protein
MSYKRGDMIVYRDKKGDAYVGQLQTNMTTQAMVVPWYSETRVLVKLLNVVGVANDAGIRFYLEQKIHHAFKQAEYYATLAGTLQGELDNLSSRRDAPSSSADAPAPLTSPSDPLN